MNESNVSYNCRVSHSSQPQSELKPNSTLAQPKPNMHMFMSMPNLHILLQFAFACFAIIAIWREMIDNGDTLHAQKSMQSS